MAGYYEEKLRPILAGLGKDARIFEVGCGGGFALGAVKRLGFTNSFGCDADAGQVADAVRCGANAKFVPVEEFPSYLSSVQGDGFDVILMFDVLEHIPVAEQRNVLFLLSRALRNNAILVCQVPNANSIVAARFRYGDWTHSSSFTEDSLDFLLFNSGFSDISISEVDDAKFPALRANFVRALLAFVLLRFFRQVRRLQLRAEGGKKFAAAPLTPNMLAIAKKAPV